MTDNVPNKMMAEDKYEDSQFQTAHSRKKNYLKNLLGLCRFALQSGLFADVHRSQKPTVGINIQDVVCLLTFLQSFGQNIHHQSGLPIVIHLSLFNNSYQL